LASVGLNSRQCENRARQPAVICQGLDVPDLLNMFAKVRGEALADDALLLG